MDEELGTNCALPPALPLPLPQPHAGSVSVLINEEHAGAIAFSRTGDPGLGEFEPAVILARYGRTAEEVE